MFLKRRILLLVFVALSALPASAQTPDLRPTPRPDIVGGWRNAKIDEAVRQAAADVVLAIKRPHIRLATINSVETQVVAGTNYRLRLTLSDGSRWEALVWRHLNGTMEVTSVHPLS